MSNLKQVVAQALRPLFNETKDGWQIRYIDSYDIEVGKADNTIKISSKFYKDKSVVISDNYWVGIKSDGTEEVIGDAQGNVWHVTEQQYLQQVKALGLINSYEFDGPMKHNIIIQPAFQAFLKSKEYVAVRFGGQMTTTNCFLGAEGQEIAGLASFMGQLQALHTNDLGDNEMLFEFQDAWLKDADDQKLDLAWHIIPEPQGNYKFYVEINAEEILARNADIVIDPSLSTLGAKSHSHHGNGIAAASNGKLAHVFCSETNAHYVPSTRLHLTVSRDEGLTWNTPWIVADAVAEGYVQNKIGDPMLVADANGNLYTFFLAMKNTVAHIGLSASDLYVRKMLPDDSFESAIRVSTDETPVATYYNDAYYNDRPASYATGLGVYDAYIFNNKLVVVWWSSSNNLNQSLVVREIDLTNMTLSTVHTVSGLIGSAYASENWTKATVLIRPYNNIAYIGVNYEAFGVYCVKFSLIQYDTVASSSSVSFTNTYSFVWTTIQNYGHYLSIGIPFFDVIDSGNSILALVQDTWEADRNVYVPSFKVLAANDGSVINDNVLMPNFAYVSASINYNPCISVKLLPLIMPNNERYWCDSDKFVRYDSTTGEAQAILPSNASSNAPSAFNKNISKFIYENRVFHSFVTSVVGYTVLGANDFVNGQAIKNYLGLFTDSGNTQYLPQHAVYVDALNTGHLVLDGKYYRSTNPVTQKPTLADFVFVDNVPQWVPGIHLNAAVYYDHLSDNLYIFAFTAANVDYCRRHAGVYTTMQRPAEFDGNYNFACASNTVGIFSDKNGNIICSVCVYSSSTYPLLRAYKVTVSTDIVTAIPIPPPPVSANYLFFGTSIKNNIGDILIPYLGFYGTSMLGTVGYYQWDGNLLTVISIPTKTYAPYYNTVNYYKTVPFVGPIYMFQDFQGEYYFVYNYVTGPNAISYPVLFSMVRTFNGVWQSETLDNLIPLDTDCLGLGLHGGAWIKDGLCKQSFYAMLNPWRNKIVVALAYREKNNVTTIYVPGMRWLEYDTQAQTWTNIASLSGYENAVIPASHRGTKGSLMLQNDYGDPRICFIEGTTSQTNFGMVGKLSIIEIDYTQARISNTAPESPRLRSPLTQTSVYNTVTPALTWYVAPDAQFDNQHYVVELSADPSFSTLMGSANSTTDQSNFKWYFGDAELPFPAEGVSSVYGTYENPTMYVIFNVPAAWGLELNTEYYWRVKTIG